MLTITNIRNKDAINNADYHYAIVRSLKANAILQLKDLSPSYELLQKYLKLKSENNWNLEKFDKIYVPQFLYEIKTNTNAKKLLNEIYMKQKTKNIVLTCFCTDENLCHRSIIAGLYQAIGVKVYGVDNDYSKYYETYKKLSL